MNKKLIGAVLATLAFSSVAVIAKTGEETHDSAAKSENSAEDHSKTGGCEKGCSGRASAGDDKATKGDDKATKGDEKSCGGANGCAAMK